ncbi:MAG: hypothetical protein RI953_518 [Pseudomonadota bacterium]
MTVNTKWLPLATLGIGLVGGWGASRLLGRPPAVLQLNETAPALVVNGRTWSYGDMPAELRNRVHTAFLQANEQLRIALEDFATRASRSGGKVDDFNWEKEAMAKIDEKALRSIYENSLGFKNRGPFDSPEIKQSLMKFAVDRERSMMISEELQKLGKENKLQFLWNLPLGVRLEEDLSIYSTLEIGTDGKPVVGTVDVMFNYAQQFGEGAFNLLYRIATDKGQRIRIRLLTEYSGTEREKKAIETIGCVTSGKFNPNEIFAIHQKLLQDVPSLKPEKPQVDWKQAFPGNADLAGRIETCTAKPLNESAMLSNTKVWQALRQNPLPILFHEGRRISEYDPRGIEAVVRFALKN